MTPQLGSAFWHLLHTFVATVPDEITPEMQNKIQLFFNGWQNSLAASAGECACLSEWRKIVGVCPPKVGTRAELVDWAVAAHDWVNQKLGKPLHRETSREHTIFRRLTPARPPSHRAFGEPVVIHSATVEPCAPCG